MPIRTPECILLIQTTDRYVDIYQKQNLIHTTTFRFATGALCYEENSDHIIVITYSILALHIGLQMEQ